MILKSWTASHRYGKRTGLETVLKRKLYLNGYHHDNGKKGAELRKAELLNRKGKKKEEHEIPPCSPSPMNHIILPVA